VCKAKDRVKAIRGKPMHMQSIFKAVYLMVRLYQRYYLKMDYVCPKGQLERGVG